MNYGGQVCNHSSMENEIWMSVASTVKLSEEFKQENPRTDGTFTMFLKKGNRENCSVCPLFRFFC